jgi:hypothetical protein
MILTLQAQNNDLHFEKIKEACEKRSKLYSNILFNVETTEIMQKGTLNKLLKYTLKGEKLKYANNPPNDLVLKGHFEYGISGNKYRWTSTKPTWIAQSGEMRECTRSDYFVDGMFYQTTTKPIIVDHQSAIIEKKATPPMLNNHALLALNLFCQFNSEETQPTHLNINNYQVSAVNRNYLGAKCIVLAMKIHTGEYLLFFDPKKDYVCIAMLTTNGNSTTSTIEINYNYDEHLQGFVPTQWKSMYNSDATGIKMTKCVINRISTSAIPKEYFDNPILKDMRVIDFTGRKEEQYVALEDGSKGVVIDGDKNPTYSQLVEFNKQASKNTTWQRCIFAGLLLACLLTLLYLKKYNAVYVQRS